MEHFEQEENLFEISVQFERERMVDKIEEQLNHKGLNLSDYYLSIFHPHKLPTVLKYGTARWDDELGTSSTQSTHYVDGTVIEEYETLRDKKLHVRDFVYTSDLKHPPYMDNEMEPSVRAQQDTYLRNQWSSHIAGQLMRLNNQNGEAMIAIYAKSGLEALRPLRSETKKFKVPATQALRGIIRVSNIPINSLADHPSRLIK